MSIDGYIADVNGKLDWIFEHSTEESRNYVSELLNSSDTILLGRGMAKEFLEYWPNYTSEFADRINSLPKIVFSKTITEMPYENVTVSGDISEEIKKQKSQSGKNLILYGGCGLATSFAKSEVIDEYHLIVIPVILGGGLHLFRDIAQKNLKLVNTIATPAGVLINKYEPK
jgi:dihydrofolate reductase